MKLLAFLSFNLLRLILQHPIPHMCMHTIDQQSAVKHLFRLAEDKEVVNGRGSMMRTAAIAHARTRAQSPLLLQRSNVARGCHGIGRQRLVDHLLRAAWRESRSE